MNKYHNIKTVIDGITFDSKKESHRYCELKLLEKIGEISDLELQPKFLVEINGKKICTYIADFRYSDVKNGDVIEDVKGFKTPVYRLKKKMVEATYSIVINEI